MEDKALGQGGEVHAGLIEFSGITEIIVNQLNWGKLRDKMPPNDPPLCLRVYNASRAHAFNRGRRSQPASRIDPGATCTVLEKNLPATLMEVRRIGKLRKEKIVDDTDYCPSEDRQCTIHSMDFDGLSLEILSDKKAKSAATLVATVSKPDWKLMGKIRVGQSLKVLEKHYGASIPRNISPIRIEGECTPLTVWHANGRVIKLVLDCQACI